MIAWVPVQQVARLDSSVEDDREESKHGGRAFEEFACGDYGIPWTEWYIFGRLTVGLDFPTDRGVEYVT